jgi:hypothetical protein
MDKQEMENLLTVRDGLKRTKARIIQMMEQLMQERI